MRKILCIVVACILALVFASVSNVSAFGAGKIRYTEWLVSTTVRWYDDAGDYQFAMAGGDSYLYIEDEARGGWIESFPLVATLWGGDPGSWGEIWFYPYTWKGDKNLLKAYYAEVYFEDSVGNPWEDWADVAKVMLTFSSTTAFKGTITIVHPDGSRCVITLKGKRLGKYAGPKPPA
jgi:hypothetical protein